MPADRAAATLLEGQRIYNSAMVQPTGARALFGIHEITANRDIWRMLIAELLGTFFLVLIACSSSIQLVGPTSITHASFISGLAVATLVQALGHVSGCQINPAVTCGFLVSGHIRILKALFYIVAQCIGGLLGAQVLQALTPEDKQGLLGLTIVNYHVTPAQAFFVEALMTFVLVLTVVAVCDGRRSDIKGSAPLAIGLAVAVGMLAAMQYTGGGLNPARTLGPAVMTGVWDHHWVYWAGPIVGGLAAGTVYTLIFRAREEENESNV